MTNQKERRRSQRATVMLSAIVEQRTGTAKARMWNISSDGAAIIGPTLAPYSKVILQREGKTLESRVIWVDGTSSGIRFEQSTAVESLLPRVAPRRPVARPAAGRPGLKCAPLSNADRLVLERWSTAGARALGD